MHISILVPTRGRPKNIARLIESVDATVEDPGKVSMVFYVDHDDSESALVVRDFIDLFRGEPINMVVGPRIVLSQMWNVCYEASDPRAEIFHHCADDVVFQTKGWDQRVREEFKSVPDRILFLFGRDGIVDDPRLGTHGFVHRNWVQTVGYFVPPYFSYCYNDTWLTDVSTRIGRKKYISDVLIEHFHPGSPKPSNLAPMDQTYVDAANRGSTDDCLGMYNAKEVERITDAAKLEKFIAGFRP